MPDVTWALILFTLQHPVPANPDVYEWRKETKAVFASQPMCSAVAALESANIPFEHDNMPYYACEKVDIEDYCDE